MEILQMIAIGVFIASTIIAYIIRVIWKTRKELIIVTIGLFLAWCLLWMTDCIEGKYVEGIDYIYCVVKMVYSTLEIFTFKVPVETIAQFTCHLKNIPQVWFTNTLYVLYFLAPMLVVGSIITFFRDFVGRCRFAISLFWGNRYIMSEINDRSIETAKSIKDTFGNSIIVFADVDAIDKRYDAEELIEQAREIDAICLKRKLTNIKLRKIFGRDEIFLIGENEAQNASQAIVLTEKYKKRRSPMSIYVYYQTDTVVEIVDSISKGEKILDNRFKHEIQRNPKNIFNESWRTQKNLKIEGTFFVSCVNPIKQTIVELLLKNYYKIHEMAKKEKKVVISIVGMGKYGVELLKTAIWLFQLYGYEVRFNVIDLDKNIKKEIECSCPDLIKNNGVRENGESNYSIYFYEGVNCSNYELENVLDRYLIKKSHLFFVALGQDDKNIDVAMRIRRYLVKNNIFENANRIKKLTGEEQIPIIYTVVSDDHMSGIACDLKCFAGQSYDIRFVGTFGEENSYSKILARRELEKEAFKHHIEWVAREKEDVSERLLEKAASYVNYSYYRDSSVAQVIYKRCIEQLDQELETIANEMSLKKNEIIKESEHMRWVVYMRMEGYSYCSVRNDMAKLHDKIVPFKELLESEQKKDDLNIDNKSKKKILGCD